MSFPMEYLFTEGTASPYEIYYDNIDGDGPYLVASSGDSSLSTYRGRKLVRTSDGTLYAIYHRRTGNTYQIYVSESTDEGVTWGNETALGSSWVDAGQNSGYMSLAVDSLDQLHAVWDGFQPGFTTVYGIWYSKFDGSWSAPTRISTGVANMDSGHQQAPVVAIDSDDDLHVLWSGRSTAHPLNSQQYYSKYDGSWSVPVRISTAAGMENDYQQNSAIAIDSRDYIHVVWFGEATGFTTGDQIWYALYDGSWQAPVRISTLAGMSAELQGNPCIAVDFLDNLHVVWYGQSTAFPSWDQIWYALYDGSWSAPVRLSTYANMSGTHQRYPSIAVESAYSLHVLWNGLATGYIVDKIWYAEFITGWAAPVVLQPTGTNKYPSMRWDFRLPEGSADLEVHFCVNQSYDFSDSRGVGFWWWGSGGVDQNVEFEMWTPTGGWVAKFPDGPAEWRWIFFTWNELTEIDLDGSRPTKSRITDIFWTYHTEGVRRVDGIVGWRKLSLKCLLVVRHSGLQELLGRCEIRHPASAELSAKLTVNP